MPSGHVLTALFNSVVNMILHLIWFLVSVPPQFADVSMYDEFVETNIYGDDSLDAVAEHMLEFLNRETMARAYARHAAMTITSSAKDGKLRPFDSVLDLTFLKRGFRRDGMIYKPILSLGSLYSMLSFVRTSKHVSLSDQLVVNLKTFFQFAYFYGPRFYNGHLALFGKLFPSVLLPQYSYYDNLFRFGKYDVFQI